MNEQSQSPQDVVSKRVKQVFVVFVIIAGFFIVAEHRAHVIPYLPWLLLAACPLMHVFMHHGHGGHQHRDRGGDSEPRGNAASTPSNTAASGPGYGASRGTSQHQHGDHS